MNEEQKKAIAATKATSTQRRSKANEESEEMVDEIFNNLMDKDFMTSLANKSREKKVRM